MPTIAAGEALCDGRACLSDRETAQLLGSYDAALIEANRRLAWLHDWIAAAAR